MLRVAMPRHVEWSHPERVGLDLERLLAAEEGFAGERIDLGNLLVGHGVAAGRGAIAVDHQELAGSPICLIVGIGEPGIDGKVVVGIRIHQAGRDRIKALGGLPITLRNLRPQVARPPADGIGPQQREAAGLVDFPDFQLRFFLEDPHQDRRFLRHVAALEIRNHALGQRLHVAPVHSNSALRVAPGKRNGSRNRDRGEKQAQYRLTMQSTPRPTGFPKPPPGRR